MGNGRLGWTAGEQFPFLPRTRRLSESSLSLPQLRCRPPLKKLAHGDETPFCGLRVKQPMPSPERLKKDDACDGSLMQKLARTETLADPSSAVAVGLETPRLPRTAGACAETLPKSKDYKTHAQHLAPSKRCHCGKMFCDNCYPLGNRQACKSE